MRGNVECTLFELATAVDEVAESEGESLAILRHLVGSGRVRLIGTLRGERTASE